MWQNLKLAAFLCCLLPWVMVAVRLAVPQSQAEPTRGMTTAELRSRLAQQRQRPNSMLAVVPIALSSMGSLLLLVDAFRRSYEGPKALPVATALTGVISLGLLSIVYYGVWGWLPTRDEGDRATDFCGRCKNETLERPAPGTSTIGGLFGTQLVGRAQRCDACGYTQNVVGRLHVAGRPAGFLSRAADRRPDLQPRVVPQPEDAFDALGPSLALPVVGGSGDGAHRIPRED